MEHWEIKQFARKQTISKLGFESRSDLKETVQPFLLILGILVRNDEVGRQINENKVKKKMSLYVLKLEQVLQVVEGDCFENEQAADS